MEAKLLSYVNRIKTPLILAGIVVFILYFLYRQILSMPVFSNIGSAPTFILLQNIVDKVFWLSVIAIVLGVLSYLISLFLKNRVRESDSRLNLIDASVDPKLSLYSPIEDKVDTTPEDEK
jgi:hypothetical protein